MRDIQLLFRRQETGNKPVVAALNGTALGGGLELALATHYRVVADSPRIKLGLPEVKLGLLPGGGGTQRLPRLIGIRQALPLLTEGTHLSPERALELGVVDAVVPAEQLLEHAKETLHQGLKGKQPWDERRFTPPGGGVQTPKGYEAFAAGNAMLQRATWGVYPAPKAIMACVYHGLQMPIDQGCKVEAREFTKLARGAVARNMIRTLFFALNDANKLRHRPEGVPKQRYTHVGVLGAGMMGAGLAYTLAKSGVAVTLIDRDMQSAERGKSYSERALKKNLSRGKITPQQAEQTLSRITPAVDYEALHDAELVIEAVFEDRAIKAQVTERAEAALPAGAIVATNTSTLPITGLAEASKNKSNFIGLHFFSPVDKMPLVEVIPGEQTSPETLARALDLIKVMRKTPIVVKDSRGFYTSRVFGTYVREGVALLSEGVEPALIEHSARMAGMPVGPLALADEISLELMHRITTQMREALSDEMPAHPADEVVTRFIKEFERPGKKRAAGFYDYPEGETKRLWPKLAELYPVASKQPTVEQVQRRLLHIQGVEAARCLEEGVLSDATDGDIGSVLGWGFAPHHGGVFSYIDTVGVEAFTRQAGELAERHGARFKPPKLLINKAKRGESFY